MKIDRRQRIFGVEPLEPRTLMSVATLAAPGQVPAQVTPPVATHPLALSANVAGGYVLLDPSAPPGARTFGIQGQGISRPGGPVQLLGRIQENAAPDGDVTSLRFSGRQGDLDIVLTGALPLTATGGVVNNVPYTLVGGSGPFTNAAVHGIAVVTVTPSPGTNGNLGRISVRLLNPHHEPIVVPPAPLPDAPIVGQVRVSPLAASATGPAFTLNGSGSYNGIPVSLSGRWANGGHDPSQLIGGLNIVSRLGVLKLQLDGPVLLPGAERDGPQLPDIFRGQQLPRLSRHDRQAAG